MAPTLVARGKKQCGTGNKYFPTTFQECRKREKLLIFPPLPPVIIFIPQKCKLMKSHISTRQAEVSKLDSLPGLVKHKVAETESLKQF